jgi:hypothetical protein
MKTNSKTEETNQHVIMNAFVFGTSVVIVIIAKVWDRHCCKVTF